jgi:hypothetical protein
MHFTSPEPSNNFSSTYSFAIASPEPLDEHDIDVDITSSEPEMCDCQNQLGHWDWNGVPHEDLPELCKRTMGITNQRKSE